jgi:hypothetical protein
MKDQLKILLIVHSMLTERPEDSSCDRQPCVSTWGICSNDPVLQGNIPFDFLFETLLIWPWFSETKFQFDPVLLCHLTVLTQGENVINALACLWLKPARGRRPGGELRRWAGSDLRRSAAAWGGRPTVTGGRRCAPPCRGSNPSHEVCSSQGRCGLWSLLHPLHLFPILLPIFLIQKCLTELSQTEGSHIKTRIKWAKFQKQVKLDIRPPLSRANSPFNFQRKAAWTLIRHHVRVMAHHDN